MAIDFSGFLLALLPVALSPGASFTLVLGSALSGGRQGLLRTLAGTALGIYTHALLIGLGISAVLLSSPQLFDGLKLAGSVYLLWLGIQLMRSGLTANAVTLDPHPPTVTLKQAWLANILNPKAIIFYLTVVAQYAGRQANLSHYLILASVHIVVMSLWLLLVSHCLRFSARNTDIGRLKKWVNTLGGWVLIVVSVHSFWG